MPMRNVAVAIHPASSGTLTNEVTKMIECSLKESQNDMSSQPSKVLSLFSRKKESLVMSIQLLSLKPLFNHFGDPVRAFALCPDWLLSSSTQQSDHLLGALSTRGCATVHALNVG